jgi:integral membrane sensor domain MASE1
MFGVLFYLLFVLLISYLYCLDVSLFEKTQDYKEEDLEQ